MEAPHHMMRIEEERDVEKIKQQVIHLNEAAASPPPSSSSSPSHEFSFTISLHSAATRIPDNKTKSPPLAIDLSPADEIFFHGHLLPLHLLSHLPVSPRSSTNSLDSLTLPIKELLHHQNNNGDHDDRESRHVLEGKERGKSKSFSLFAGMPKWRKDKDEDDQQTQKRKSRFELLKRYVSFVKPFLSLRNRRQGNSDGRQQLYSYSSGNLRVRNNKRNLVRGRRGEFSAPASMTTSPANSGPLVVATGASTPAVKTSDSTMEELQAAIQAAIAHCKNSIATADQDKIKLPQ